MQFFVKPGEEMKWYAFWKEKRMKWHTVIGLGEDNYRYHDHLNLAHYANAACDIQFNFPMGFKELEGIHSRTDFDLKSHEKYSGKKLQYFDPEANQSYIPYVVETSIGLDRCFLAVLSKTYREGLLGRATVRAMAGIIACDIHPLNNTRVGRKLNHMGVEQSAILEWTQGWIRDGFDALEPMVAKHAGEFAFGDTPTIADCCLIPQVYSATRYEVDLGPWPAITGSSTRMTKIARIVPALRGYDVAPAFEITASGPLDAMTVDLDASARERFAAHPRRRQRSPGRDRRRPHRHIRIPERLVPAHRARAPREASRQRPAGGRSSMTCRPAGIRNP